MKRNNNTKIIIVLLVVIIVILFIIGILPFFYANISISRTNALSFAINTITIVVAVFAVIGAILTVNQAFTK